MVRANDRARRQVLKNFNAMPAILKWLTSLCLVLPIFLIVSLIPHGSINVNGRATANSEWWATGAGAVVLILAIAMTTAGLLLLNRSPYARRVYIVGMLATFLSGPLAASLAHSDVAEPLWSTLLGASDRRCNSLVSIREQAHRQILSCREQITRRPRSHAWTYGWQQL
jgi:hypothetical protein